MSTPPPPPGSTPPPPPATPPTKTSRAIDLDMDLDFIAFDVSPPPQPSYSLPSSLPSRPFVPAWGNTPIPQVAGKKRAHENTDYGTDVENQRKKRTLKDERREFGRELPWTKQVDWHLCKSVVEMFNAETLEFVRYVQPTAEENRVRGYLIDLIGEAIRTKWPDAKTFAFGSYETGLYLPHGDIDLVVQSESMAGRNIKKVLEEMAILIHKQGISQEKVQVISQAKVPIIKFKTSYGAFDVDMSVNSDNGIQACHVVKQYIQHLPALRPMVFLVKWFLAQRGLNEVFSGGLGSYAITCFCASFLQQQPKLRRCEINPFKNLGVLFLELLDLYGRTFDNDNMGISIRNGGYYFTKRSRGWFNERRSNAFCVEDPQNPSNDISGGTAAINNIKQAFTGGYQAITAALQTREREWRRRNEAPDGHPDALLWVDSDGGPDDAAMSILGSVIGFESKLVKHRKDVLDTYKKGALQHKLKKGKHDPAKSVQADGGPPYLPMTGLEFSMAAYQVNGSDTAGPSYSLPDQRGATTANAIMVDDDDEGEEDELDDEAGPSGGAAGLNGNYYHDMSDDEDDEEEEMNSRESRHAQLQAQAQAATPGLSKTARRRQRKAAMAAAVTPAEKAAVEKAVKKAGKKKTTRHNKLQKKEKKEREAREAKEMDDSRYAIGLKEEKDDPTFMGDESGSSGEESMEMDEEEEEGEVVEPVRPKKKLRKADKQAYWAGKGPVGREDESVDMTRETLARQSKGNGVDAIEANADFVSFD